MFNLDIKNKEMFKYNEEILYLLISYIIGNSLNFGHHFIELAFNPIEKEYFIVKSNKYSNYNQISLSNISQNRNMINEEPFFLSI